MGEQGLTNYALSSAAAPPHSPLISLSSLGLALLASTRLTREEDVGVGNTAETSTRGSLSMD